MVAKCRLVAFALVAALPACGASPEDLAADADTADAPADDALAADAAVAPPDAADDAAPDASDDAAVEAEAGPPPGMLDTTVTSQIVEPEGGGKDDASHSFTDKNYWNFCMPGAVTVALYYFLPNNVTGWTAGYFKEPSNAPSTIPSSGTYWKSDEKVNGYHTYGRAYLMHLAEQVKPPSYGSAGMVSFASYPTTGANLVDARDALNWEASGHASGWSTFFYSIVSSKGLTASKLHADVTKTIDGGHAVVVAADTGYLPNWSRSLSHAITVVGYDDKASTYKYTDTCGVHCNGSAKAKNGGVWTIGQTKLFDAIVADGAGYVK
jgi:hypothetical protein